MLGKAERACLIDAGDTAASVAVHRQQHKRGQVLGGPRRRVLLLLPPQGSQLQEVRMAHEYHHRCAPGQCERQEHTQAQDGSPQLQLHDTFQDDTWGSKEAIPSDSDDQQRSEDHGNDSRGGKHLAEGFLPADKTFPQIGEMGNLNYHCHQDRPGFGSRGGWTGPFP